MIVIESSRRHVLWTAGLLQCVVVTRRDPTRFAVQVLDRDHIVVSEPCRGQDQAIEIGEMLWSMLVDRPAAADGSVRRDQPL